MQAKQKQYAIRILGLAVGIGLLASSAAAQDPAGGLIPSTVASPQPPIPTFWQKFGIPQNTARIRDSLLNRRGNLPFLEKKPPVLKLADPRNLMKGQPEMVKAAAEIKMAKDAKPQKIKALKFLADVNCGCYNKDGKVEGAFLEALDDCDPEVRKAAIEGLSKAAGKDCNSCRERLKKACGCKQCQSANGCNDCGDGCNECNQGCQSCGDSCAITCCTRKLQDKLEDIAYGMKDGCYKEPVLEIRAAAEALLCKCPPAPLEPEELVRPDRNAPEELVRPEEFVPPDVQRRREEERKKKEGATGQNNSTNGGYSMQLSDQNLRRNFYATSRQAVEYSMNDGNSVVVPGILAGATASSEARRLVEQNPNGQLISNPALLLDCRTVVYNSTLGELLLEMPFASHLETGMKVVVVDQVGSQVMGTVSDVGGRRILVALDYARAIETRNGATVGFGVVAR